jgi:hypothetical protein
MRILRHKIKTSDNPSEKQKTEIKEEKETTGAYTNAVSFKDKRFAQKMGRDLTMHRLRLNSR